MSSDPSGLLADLEAGHWQEHLSEARRTSLLEDVKETLARQGAVKGIELSQGRAGKAMELSQGIGAGRAGKAEIRQAEETGALSASQAARAEIALQAQQMASDELAVSLSSGVGFDLENPQNRKAADAFYETTFSQAIREGVSEEVLAQVVSAVTRTGYLPPRLARDTTGLLHGSDSARRVAGAELYGGLRDAAPVFTRLAFDPETRARGGILKRWLDAGLEPSDALQRTEAEFPRDGNIQILPADELKVLKRDLGSLFTGAHAGHRVDEILEQLKQNYLDDLGKGLTPRGARHQLRRDAGRVMRKLGLMRDEAEGEPGLSGDGRSSLLVPVRSIGEATKQAARGSGGAKPRNPLYGPYHPSDDKLSQAATQELQRGAESVIDTLIELYHIYNNFVSEVRAKNFPGYAASFFDNAMVSIGDGENHLSFILDEHKRNGTRSLGFKHPEHGGMVVRQRYDISAQRFENLDVTFKAPETGEYVTEKLPNSRFYVPASDKDDPLSPPLRPQSGEEFNPGGFGELGNPDQPIMTTGNPPDNSTHTKSQGGFVPIGLDGPRITSFPDQSDELNIPIILLSEGGYRNAEKGDLSADGTFTWYYPGRYRSNKQLKREYENHYGIIWPRDPETGYYQDVSHEKALADGGPDHFMFIRPRPRKEHIELHRERGDFKRWQEQKEK